MSEKIGIYVCECGPNIADKVDIENIMDEISKLEDFKNKELVVKKHKLLCSNEGKEFLEKEINENKLTHLVCAACSPRDHDTTFINVCKKTHLNPYLYRIVNIREHCAWIIPDKDEATKKAIQYIHAGMNRVLYQDSLFEKELDSNPDVLVIGGGIAGMEAALNLAGEQRRVFLIDKGETLGGKAAFLTEQNIVQQKISDIQKNNNIKVFTKTVLDKLIGFMGNFEIVLKSTENPDETTELLAGALVVAIGYELFNSKKLSEFNYEDNDDVINSLELGRMFSENKKITLKNGKEPKSVTLVHCVGREKVGFCSKICCNYMLRISNYLKEQSSNIKITHLIKYLNLPYKEDQNFYNKINEKGVEFIRYSDLSVKGTKVEYTDINDKKGKLESELVILAPAMIASKDSEELADMLNIDLHETGYFQEIHQKINPVSSTTDGIFIIGSARGPANIVDAMQQAKAATGKIFTQLIPGEKIVPEVMVSEILEAYCTGCQTCLNVCSYDAIYFDDERGISVVNEAVCRGCGNCVGSCPSGSIRTKHFTNPQLYQEVKEAIR
jgi:heterodisulfide reductase subunit A